MWSNLFANLTVVGSIHAIPPTATGVTPGSNVFVFSNAAGQSMLMDSSGKVGIGTKNPAADLDVSGTINAAGYYLNGVTLSNVLSFVGATGATGAAGYIGTNGATGPAGTNGATGPAGTNGATGPAGTTGATGPAGTNGATGPDGTNGATGPAGTNGATGATGAAGATGPAPAGSTGAMLYLSSSGVVAATTVPDLVWDNTNKRLGIGTNPTTYTFQVNGTVGVSGDITALYSDERLKTKTGALVNALDKVCMLDTFTYVSNELAQKYGFTDSTQRVGLSAQQVQKVLPEVVKPAPFDADNLSGQNFLTVQYDKLVPLLIESIKELKVRLEHLEKQT